MANPAGGNKKLVALPVVNGVDKQKILAYLSQISAVDKKAAARYNFRFLC